MITRLLMILCIVVAVRGGVLAASRLAAEPLPDAHLAEAIESIVLNILADFIFLAAGMGGTWIFFTLTHRRRLLRFYGVDDSKKIVIYVANLRVKRFGAIGIDGKERSYAGSAGAFGEVLVANRFGELFRYPLSSLPDRPGLLSKLLVSDVQVQILPSPLDEGQLEPSSSFISLGSPAYNIASGFVEQKLDPQARFMNDYREIVVRGVPAITDWTYGFVERIVDHDQNRCIFYAAGLGEHGTAGAAHFLAREWKRLYRKYGSDTAFVVMLRFEPRDFRRSSIAFERSAEAQEPGGS